ncbi:protein WVD2-like 7 [Neltuma alba]|uniref:protein WVD2-like 7 n=1 Tax=Neltuma alba TaxID=207710 RepID=UPI0010A34ECF|nr:protein WVD2-like 7 [Prosopis alba]XP_028758989.1 protein WVD2-like 7 [Prosopis alba]
MAGEIEETFSFNFQADSIHSGSISFGRFENEPLSWERRSSFSHNRYLEEVEKCSKPGSVIEKKAYFEAHFKKKGLLGFNIPVSQDGSDQTTSENDGSERISNQEDFESNENVHGVHFDRRLQEDFEPIEDDQFVQFDQRSLEDFEPIVDDHYDQYEQRSFEDFGPDEDGDRILFDEGPAGSDPNGGNGETGYEKEDLVTEGPRVSSSNQHMEFAINNYDVLEDAIDNTRILDEAPKPENETSSTISADDTTVVEVKRDHDDTVNNDESLRTMNATEPTRGVEQAAMNDPPSPSPKETKPEHGLSSVATTVQVRTKSSARSPKGLARNSSRESPRKTNVGKNSSKLATPMTHSINKTPKEVPKSERKATCERKSEKVLAIKKAAESQPSVLKANSRGIQEAKRVNPTVHSSSTNSEARPRDAAFNFKSGERAERRKEFYLKLEEKMHAREVQMNQMKAISKEKTEAEIRKLRRVLTLKRHLCLPFIAQLLLQIQM